MSAELLRVAGTADVTCECGHSIDRHDPAFGRCRDCWMSDAVADDVCARKPSQIAADAVAAARAEAAERRLARVGDAAPDANTAGAPVPQRDADPVLDPERWENTLDDAWPREGGRAHIVRVLAAEVVASLALQRDVGVREAQATREAEPCRCDPAGVNKHAGVCPVSNPHRDAGVREAVLAELLDECYVTSSTAPRCADFIGATFPNGGEWTREMCCLPCRLRAAVESAPATREAEDAAALVDRSSLGTPGAKAARATVSDEHAARIVARARELEAEGRARADERGESS